MVVGMLVGPFLSWRVFRRSTSEVPIQHRAGRCRRLGVARQGRVPSSGSEAVVARLFTREEYLPYSGLTNAGLRMSDV